MNQTFKHIDTDPRETQEWIESLKAILESEGVERTHFIIEKMIEFYSLTVAICAHHSVLILILK